MSWYEKVMFAIGNAVVFFGLARLAGWALAAASKHDREVDRKREYEKYRAEEDRRTSRGNYA